VEAVTCLGAMTTRQGTGRREASVTKGVRPGEIRGPVGGWRDGRRNFTPLVNGPKRFCFWRDMENPPNEKPVFTGLVAGDRFELSTKGL
jgi:hypothetical protein